MDLADYEVVREVMTRWKTRLWLPVLWTEELEFKASLGLTYSLEDWMISDLIYLFMHWKICDHE
ncbi:MULTISPECIES: hypothetical protein [unclassified Nodularia (in: cyanobacteria)]|uniref:hypothetical protein n=1 Tax=unclassified Nodularia (in: cyanobacteria) TaxID=2656917 RepID=UPI00188129E7|nr:MULTISPECIES: hypothetical protein [unclassified Nodularia (in: cyanobacteria)]MBE9200537.1 hypothetical protein [Nodularia sp. LEGE 06071]MCC2692559.1 hypothetical protein [Nodularia sp. LEGE 04288]